MIADTKILSWMMRGAAEYNKVDRDVDLNLLAEALEPSHRPVFRTIKDYFVRYRTPPSYQILVDNFVKDMDTNQLVHVLQEDVCKETEILFYLDKVKNRFNAELAVHLSKSVGESPDNIDIDAFNSNLIGLASKIDRLRKSSVFAEGSLDTSVKERYARYKHTEENPESIAGILTGYRDIDDYTFGLRNSEMMVISGASSSGKSLLMLNIGVNAWIGQNNPMLGKLQEFLPGKNVLYFTLEMSKEQLEHRIDAKMADLLHRNLVRGILTKDEKKRWGKSLEFQSAFGQSNKFYIVDIPRGSRTIDVEARYDSICAEFQPDLVCVDYLGIMKPNRDFGQDWLEVGHVAEDLHEFCRNKDIPLISAAQRKAKGKNDDGKYNDLEDLARSKLIGDNANIVLLISKREDEHLKVDMEVSIVKNRDGKKGVIYLEKQFERSKIVDFPLDWTTDYGTENES